MREIKFRAWLPDIQMMNNWMSGVDGGTKENIESYLDDPDSILMQYTGLKDKNGKEIYEGDIVHFKTKGGNEMTYDVRYSDYHAGFKPTRLTQTNYQEITVIGNIYENPELLTPTKTDKQ